MLRSSLGSRQAEVLKLLVSRGPYYHGCHWSASCGYSKTEEVLRRLVEMGLVERDTLGTRGEPIYLPTFAGRLEACFP